MAVPPFGFSVGDFIAVIDLLQKVGKALHSQNGVSAEYQRLIQIFKASALFSSTLNV
jgi:hypothetical protein